MRTLLFVLSLFLFTDDLLGRSAGKSPAPEEGVRTVYYKDSDRDGWGDPKRTVEAASVPEGYVSRAGDCEDINAKVYPGAPETCDGVDNNCNGTRDEGFAVQTYYRDADKDGWGSNTDSTTACLQPPGFLAVKGDCSDWNAALFPGAAEVCDGLDNNCNGTRDEGFEVKTLYKDNDGDGFGGNTRITACTTPPGYVFIGGDCKDTDSTRYPGRPEKQDGIDNDCDGIVDNGFPSTGPPDNGPGPEDSAKVELRLTAYPNPSGRQFTIRVASRYTQVVHLRVIDAMGRVIEVRRDVRPNGTVIMGGAWHPGLYFLEGVQGNRETTIRLLKDRL
ncbi:MAG TPA: MopE-related protein [Chitinophagaceae bacterium]|jgi:hypothetical protein|nr:MopE-related protein [Chitinophagaceae bacterium]